MEYVFRKITSYDCTSLPGTSCLDITYYDKVVIIVSSFGFINLGKDIVMDRVVASFYQHIFK